MSGPFVTCVLLAEDLPLVTTMACAMSRHVHPDRDPMALRMWSHGLAGHMLPGWLEFRDWAAASLTGYRHYEARFGAPGGDDGRLVEEMACAMAVGYRPEYDPRTLQPQPPWEAGQPRVQRWEQYRDLAAAGLAGYRQHFAGQAAAVGSGAQSQV